MQENVRISSKSFRKTRMTYNVLCSINLAEKFIK